MESKHFNRALDAKLIELVRERPVLYKRTDINYKDNFFKDKAWGEVSNEVGKTVTDCKTRWRTIRDSYKKNKRKQGVIGSHSKYNNRKLKFLDASFRQSPKDCVEVNVSLTNRKNGPNSKKEKSPETKEKMNIIKESVASNTILVENTEHPIQTFFKSMASTVMTFPNYLIAETRLKVCNLVTEMELRAITESSKLQSKDISKSKATSSQVEKNANREYDDIQEIKEIVFCD